MSYRTFKKIAKKQHFVVEEDADFITVTKNDIEMKISKRRTSCIILNSEDNSMIPVVLMKAAMELAELPVDDRGGNMATISELKKMSTEEFVEYMNENMEEYSGCATGNCGKINGVWFDVYFENRDSVVYALKHRKENWNDEHLKEYNIKTIEDFDELDEESQSRLTEILYNGNDSEIDAYYMAEQKDEIIKQLEDNGYDDEDEEE